MKLELPGFNNSVVYVEVHLNERDKSIHLLDRQACYNTSLTQAIDYNFQLLIFKKLNINDRIENYSWYLYHTDDTISKFENQGFEFVGKHENEQLYQPYINIMEDLNKVRRALVLFNEDPNSILADMIVEKHLFNPEIFEGLESVTKENPKDPNTISFLPDSFWKRYKDNLKQDAFLEIKKILCGDEESDSIRAKLVKLISENKITSKSAIVVTISMYIAAKLGNAEIGLVISSVIVALSKIAKKVSLTFVDSFCKTINEL